MSHGAAQPIPLLITASQQGWACKAAPRPSSSTLLPWAGTPPTDPNWAPGNLPSTVPATQGHRLPMTFCHLHCGRILRAHWKSPSGVAGAEVTVVQGHCGVGSLLGIWGGQKALPQHCSPPRWTSIAQQHPEDGTKLTTARILKERIHRDGGACLGTRQHSSMARNEPPDGLSCHCHNPGADDGTDTAPTAQGPSQNLPPTDPTDPTASRLLAHSRACHWEHREPLPALTGRRGGGSGR